MSISVDGGPLLDRLVARSQAAAVPLEVLFEITHRCNLPCTHCYLPDHEDHGELTFDEICGVLDQLVEAGTVFLTLTGGEVLSRRDALEIVDAAAARGFVVKVLSNATLITDEVAERFARAGVLEVSVSVYGTTAEVHDRVTEMPGSFERTMAGIERLRARGIRVALKAPLLAANGQVARDVRALTQLQNMPCTLDLSIAPKTNGDPGPIALMLNKAQMVRLMSEPGLSELLIPNDGTGPGPEPCNAGRAYCAIGPTGDVVPCIMMPEVVGNLRTQRFADVWRGGGLLGRLRAMTAESLTTCRSCDVKGSCSRCPGVAMTRGQGIDGCDLSAREVARARVAARHRLRVVAG